MYAICPGEPNCNCIYFVHTEKQWTSFFTLLNSKFRFFTFVHLNLPKDLFTTTLYTLRITVSSLTKNQFVSNTTGTNGIKNVLCWGLGCHGFKLSTFADLCLEFINWMEMLVWIRGKIGAAVTMECSVLECLMWEGSGDIDNYKEIDIDWFTMKQLMHIAY